MGFSDGGTFAAILGGIAPLCSSMGISSRDIGDNFDELVEKVEEGFDSFNVNDMMDAMA
eukprot:NODE_3911_length_371_cov_302.416149_g3336_i0.p1 GENE.NODE_3911_length_371_cov_302.416149_g3336_i0~~NODE_3911_length_371_cov_302.416149_g3336_i0.p1  ORF type:complete len:59 (-),score=11.95 NODE_3911_length_371_cov_302.416149_g3336_i0:165-341(-)